MLSSLLVTEELINYQGDLQHGILLMKLMSKVLLIALPITLLCG